MAGGGDSDDFTLVGIIHISIGDSTCWVARHVVHILLLCSYLHASITTSFGREEHWATIIFLYATYTTWYAN